MCNLSVHVTLGFPVRRDDPVSGVTISRELGVDAIEEEQEKADARLQAQIEKEREEHLKQDPEQHDEL
jgi:hypothetical protein